MPETTRLSGIPRRRLAIDATAEQFAQWALTQHENECRECGNPNSDSRCPAGARFAAAASQANDDLPGYLA
jgi:hypothetical protein